MVDDQMPTTIAEVAQRESARPETWTDVTDLTEAEFLEMLRSGKGGPVSEPRKRAQ